MKNIPDFKCGEIGNRFSNYSFGFPAALTIILTYPITPIKSW